MRSLGEAHWQGHRRSLDVAVVKEDCRWRWPCVSPYNALMNRLLDKTIVTLCCVALLAQGTIGALQIAWLCAAIAVSCVAEIALHRTRLACALAMLGCGIVFPEARPFMPLAVYDAARLDRLSHPQPVAAVVAALAIFDVVQFGRMAPLATLFALLAGMLSVRTTQAARAAARNRRTRDALQERALSLESKNRDLVDRQSCEVELATLSERARIAREIHDNVGHLLTRASLQVEALHVVHANEPGTAADFADVGATVAEALDAVRSSVHALRDDSCDLSVQMATVVERSRSDRLHIDADISAEKAPANVTAALLAVLRESISNAQRHGHAQHLQVRCIDRTTLWQLTVDDDGRADAVSASESVGMGLASMRERVEALGGSFYAGPRGSARGWRVFASIPKPEGTQS